MKTFGYILSSMLSLLVLMVLPSATALAAGDANHPNTGECPAQTEASPGFRSYLPDCRAYELVTPAFKNGQPPIVTNAATTSSGSAFFFESLGAFGEPGTDSAADGAEYVAARTSEGWTSKPINPSAAEFVEANPFEFSAGESLDASSDLSESLFLKRRIGTNPIDFHFWRRRKSDGAVQEVGALFPPETVAAWTPSETEERIYVSPVYAGATRDLSHVLFSEGPIPQSGVARPNRYLWPGDATINGGSLYQYVGLNNSEPELVGVANPTSLTAAAATEGKLHINEAAKLISQCGTTLGGIAERAPVEFSSANFNAISNSGESIVFTAREGGCEAEEKVGAGPPVREIYARVGRRETVPISNPVGECASCDFSELEQLELKWSGSEFEGSVEEKATLKAKAGSLAPVFQGASEDGEKVFFFSGANLFHSSEAGPYLYEYDFNEPQGQRLALIAPALAPAAPIKGEPVEPGGVVAVSKTGSRVYFVSTAVLPGASANEFGSRAATGAENLYTYDTESGNSRFVATLAPEDEAAWQAIKAQAASSAEVTPDGRFLLLRSANDLTRDAGGGAAQLYRYDAEPSNAELAAGVARLIRVSIGAPGTFECPRTHRDEAGFNCDGNTGPPPSSESPFEPSYGRLGVQMQEGAMLARESPVSITSDGAAIFFASPLALVPEALNEVCAHESNGQCQAAALNVYEWRQGRVYLVSDGIDAQPLFVAGATKLLGAAPSGTDVFFTSSDQLVPQDDNSAVDIYDARVDGGFPPPPAAPTSCEGDGCEGPATAPPGFATPASTAIIGSANLTAPLGAHPPPRVKRTPAQVRAEKLSKSLKVCHKSRSRTRRVSCEKKARARYGTKARAKTKRRTHS